MFKLGLKLWSNNRNYYEEAKRLVKDGFCDYIELYTFPDTLDEFGPLWKLIDVPYIVHATHFMHGMNLAKPECRASNDQLATAAFAFADLLNAKHVIFHPGVEGDDEETIRQLNAWSDERKQRILIENKPYCSIDKPPLRCNGHSPMAIRRIMDETGVGFCFDIGHGVCSSNGRGVDPFEDLMKYESLQPRMYHLSDNDFASPIDGHKHLGDGDYDFARIFRLIDTKKPISIETMKDNFESLKDFENDVSFLKNRLYGFTLKRAEMEDMKDVFELANDPIVRANAIHSEPILWKTHQVWFTSKITNSATYFWDVFDPSSQFVGYVRYDLDVPKQYWKCTVAFSSKIRGKGIGTFALKKTLRLLRVVSSAPVEAWVKKTNVPSTRAFVKSGYRLIDVKNLDGIEYHVFQNTE